MRRPITLAAVAALVAPLWVTGTAAADTQPEAPAAGGYETGTTVVGEVQRVVIDRTDLPAVVLTAVVPDAGARLMVDDAGLAGVDAGETVSVVVVEPGDATADAVDPAGTATVTDVEVVETPRVEGLARGAAPLVPLVGRPVHVVTGTVGVQTGDGVTAAALATDIGAGVTPYWVDSTNGKVSFTAASQRSGYVYDAWGDTETCTGNQIMSLLDASLAFAGAGAVWGTGVHSVLYTPPFPSCGDFAGVAHLGDGGGAWIPGDTNAASRRVTIAHELGHTVGLGHSDTLVECYDGAGSPKQDGAYEDCIHGEYGDAYDVMGVSAPGLMGPLSGLQLDGLGLLDATNTVRATVGTTATLSAVGGLTGVRFLTVESGERTYYVEYRTRVGRDSDLGEQRAGCVDGAHACEVVALYEPGVIVRTWMPGPTSEWGTEWISALLDPSITDPQLSENTPWFVMRPGHPLVTADGALSIHLNWTTPEHASVTVRHGHQTSGSAPYPQVVATNDITGDGRSDIVTVDGAGMAQLHPGSGGGQLAAPTALPGDWRGQKLYAPGDWSGDVRNDLMAVDGRGDLYLMPTNGRGVVGTPKKVGNGWTGYRIVPAGDMNGDSLADLLAIDPSGALWLYPGNGIGGFGKRYQVGNGWSSYALYAGGDMNKDGKRDILGISNGTLYTYFGQGGGYFQKKMSTGAGWRGFVFASGSDFNGDRREDLMGKDSSGNLWFYAATTTPGKFATAQKIRTGW